MAKLTPPSSTVAPSGCGRPRSKVGSRSATERRRVLLVLVALVELNDVSFRVGDPDDSHAFDQAAHVERAERDSRVVADLGELRVEVVDEERDVTPAGVLRPRTVALARRRLA